MRKKFLPDTHFLNYINGQRIARNFNAFTESSDRFGDIDINDSLLG
jgi:hypothetical protein